VGIVHRAVINKDVGAVDRGSKQESAKFIESLLSQDYARDLYLRPRRL